MVVKMLKVYKMLSTHSTEHSYVIALVHILKYVLCCCLLNIDRLPFQCCMWIHGDDLLLLPGFLVYNRIIEDEVIFF
jgi:hypothetical protein